MKSYKARGIVLHSVKYGDNASIVYMLTDVLGRQSYMVQGVRGARRSGNKAALIQPMFLLEFEGYELPAAQLHRMKDTRAAVPLKTLPFDVRKSTISLFMAETLYRLVKEAEADSPLFDFVFSAVQQLDNMEDGISNFHLWFLVRLSYYMGFSPSNEYTLGGWFDISSGGFTPIKPTHSLIMDSDNTSILADMIDCETEQLGEVGLSRHQRSSFMTAMLSYFGYHLDATREIRSVKILSEVF